MAGDVKLIDFGIASAIQQERTSVTRDQQIGTVNYMSPEAIVDTCGGSRTDASGNIRPHIKVSGQSVNLLNICLGFIPGKAPSVIERHPVS